MYSITVKIDGVESRRRSAGLLHMVIGFFLIAKGADLYRYLEYKNFLPVIPVLLVASFSIFYGFLRKKLDPLAVNNQRLRLVQAVTFFALGLMLANVGRPVDYIGVFLFVLLSLMLLFSERRVFQETAIELGEAGIRIPGNYRDHLLGWSELTSVVVREDFLTIFHKKEKYLQYKVMQDLSTLELAKMNAFCKERIEEENAPMAEREK
ncbi:MAG TPA: hypothetical protein VFR58_02330 [Flavisolibacter sp.]|nr:hypothetical protein [Flavisolibacter sp.]